MRVFLFFSAVVSKCWAYNTPQYTHDLARDNFKLVPYFAKPFVSKYKLSAYEREELIQEGYIGLVYACRKYDETFNIAISTYSSYWVRSYMNQYVKNIKKHKPPLVLEPDRYITPSTDAVTELALIMDNLEPWDREFVRKRFFDRMTIKELACYYSVSRNTITSYSTRIKHKILGHIMRQNLLLNGERTGRMH